MLNWTKHKIQILKCVIIINMKIALITGVNGQDGSYLTEFLLEKGYVVHGLIRRSATPNTQNIKHLLNNKKFILHFGDMSDSTSIFNIIANVKPDEIYNLAAQSHVPTSFKEPLITSDVDALGITRILEAVKTLKLSETKIYQASTSELFGKVTQIPQNEKTPFHPYSPYAIAKQYAYWMVREYRESYGMFACNGILFNHESERRGELFVTRKLSLAAARISLGLQNYVELGNPNSLRDWGYAKDYVKCMWLILQQDKPDDYVIATGEQHTVREFAEKAFKENGIDLIWRGKGLKEVGINKANGKIIIKINKKNISPTEVNNLLGDPTKAKKKLGWKPSCTSFDQLVHIMCASDRKLALKEKKNEKE